MKHTLIILSIVFLFSACGSDERKGERSGEGRDLSDIEELATRGLEIFRDRGFGEYEVACADCHADFDEQLADDDAIRPGHSIIGAHRRPKTWNGQFSGTALKSTAAGASKCAHLFQDRGTSVANALTQSEADALMAFYEYVSTGTEAMMLQWDALTWPGDTSLSRDALKAEVERLTAMRGNAERGEALFKRCCARCHHNGYAPAVRMLKRNITRNMRAGYGSMPFFSRDKLSDQDVADIRTFLEGK